MAAQNCNGKWVKEVFRGWRPRSNEFDSDIGAIECLFAQSIFMITYLPLGKCKFRRCHTLGNNWFRFLFGSWLRILMKRWRYVSRISFKIFPNVCPFVLWRPWPWPDFFVSLLIFLIELVSIVFGFSVVVFIERNRMHAIQLELSLSHNTQLSHVAKRVVESSLDAIR